MRKIIPGFAIFIFLSSFFSACAADKVLLFVAEEYWWETLSQTPDFGEKLQTLCRDEGYKPVIHIIQKNRNYQEDLRQAITASSCTIVVTSPLLIPEVIRLSAQFSNIRFMILGAPVIDGEWPAGVIPLAQGSLLGYYNAGRAAGRLVSSGKPELYGRKAGMVRTGLGQAEKEAVSEFERGFSQEASLSLLVVEDIGDGADKVRSVQAIDNLAAQDVRVFFIKSPLSAASCIEKISGLGGYFIIEDFLVYGQARDRCIGSVEYDLLAGLRTGIIRAPLWKGAAGTGTGQELLPVIPSEFVPAGGFAGILGAKTQEPQEKTGKTGA